MLKFIALKPNPESKVPRIQKLLDMISGDKNEGFYKLANSLFHSNNLNPQYSLIAFQDIISLAPLNGTMPYEEEKISPLSSYKWLYLIYSLSVKQLTTDLELEVGRIEYLFTQFLFYIEKSDYSKPFVLPFICGILSVAAHILDKLDKKFFPHNFVSDHAFQLLFKLFQLEIVSDTEKTIATADFSEPNIFAFCLPLSLEFISPLNVFQDMKTLLSASVLRVLIRILPVALPSNLSEFKNLIQPFAVSGVTKQAGEAALILLFKGNEDAAFKFSDQICYSSLVKIIEELYKTSNKFSVSLSYSDSITLSKQLKGLNDISIIRPQNWVNYLHENSELSTILCSIATSGYNQDFIVATVTLLRIGEVKLTHDLILFLLQLLISSSLPVLRDESSKLLLLNYEEIISEIPKILPEVSNCGSHSETFFSFLKELVPKLGDKSADLIKSIQNSIVCETNSLKKLPNSFLYSQISQYIDFPASYLDTRPCMICNNPEIKATRYMLSDIREFIKFSHDQLFVKFNTPLILQSIDLNFYAKKTTRLPRIVEVYVSSQELNDPNELKSKKPQWSHVCDLEFERDSNTAKVDFPLSLFATCIQFHYTEFWEEAEGQRLSCPLCHNGKPDPRSGLCPNCHENIYQCRDCRYTNYEHLDGFLCAECGSSPYCNFETHVTAIRSFSHTHISNENECDTSLSKADELLAEAHKYFSQLSNYKKDIDNVISPTNNLTVSEKTNKLQDLYNEKCRNLFNQLTQVVQHVCSIRSAVGKYKNRITNSLSHADFNSCYNCRKTYLLNSLHFLGELTTLPETILQQVEIPKLLISFSDDPLFGSTSIKSLTNYCKININLTNNILSLFKQNLPNPSPALVNLVCSLQEIDDGYKQQRLETLVNCLNYCFEFLTSSPSFTSLVFQPIFESICKSPLIIRQKEKYLKYKILKEFSSKINLKRNYTLCLDLFDEKLMKVLLVECTNQSVRQIFSCLLKDTSEISHEIKLKIYENSLKILREFKYFSEQQIELYNLLQEILNTDKQIKYKAFHDGFFTTICHFLENEVDKTVKTEGELVLDLNVGIGIKQITNLILCFTRNQVISRFIIIKKPEIAEKLIVSYFKLRSLIVQRSKHLDDSLNSLKEFAMLMMSKEFSLDKNDDISDIQNQTFENFTVSNSATQSMEDINPDEDNYSDHYDDYGDIDDEQDNTTQPIQAEPSPPPSPEKQNEEIEEIKSNNENGPKLMMKAAAQCVNLCPEVAIRELCNIVFPPKIAKNCPVVTKKFPPHEDFLPGRLPSSPVMSAKIGTLMRHIKNKICTDLGMPGVIEDDHGMELLVNNNIISLDLEIEDVYNKVWLQNHEDNSPMVVICRIQGLSGEATEPMITSFPRSEENEEDPATKYSYTTALIESGGLSQLIDATQISLPFKSLESLAKLLTAFVYVPSNRAALLKLNGVDKLFSMLDKIVKTNYCDLFNSILEILQKLTNETEEFSNPESKIDFIFNALESDLVRNNNKLVSPLLSLVPSLASKSKQIMEKTLNKFMERIKHKEDENINLFDKPESLFMLNGFAEFTLAIPTTTEGNEVRSLLMKHKLVDEAFNYLMGKFPADKSVTSPEWQEGVKCDGVPSSLKMLAGLVRGYDTAQSEFIVNDCQRIYFLISLSGVASTTNIGEFANNVLLNATEDPSTIKDIISNIKAKLEQEAKDKAQKDREIAIAKANEGLNNDFLKMLNDLGDDSEWGCVICKEGFEERPDEPLSLYVYSNKIGDYANTATHFVLVHKNCHMKAKTKDTRGRQGLNEWEAAMVRNCERPCNAMFPLQGPSQTDSDYLSKLNCYVRDETNTSDVFRQVWFDVTTHIKNFATNTNISFGNGGGSVPNVVALIPFLVHAGFIALGEDTKSYESKMERLLSTGQDPEDAAALALWTLYPEEFNAVKIKMLKNLLVKSEANNFKDAKSSLIFIIFISRAFEMLYNDSGIDPVFNGGELVVSNKDKKKTAMNVRTLVVEEPAKTKNDWILFGEEMEDEIMQVDNLQAALLMAGINTGSDSPEEWLAKQVQPK
ncbi:hypothetical protein TVAG_266710 [Trichomonas vaginalis G3]|uniref:E3 ubiquitin ligase UBR4 C-terminal domain-containing protein n=1 Tax=Trichomonas vaginalis (strain ATCC PRA-98 / G3) TaxID=412133 RepID=A2DQM4_TRIV3|nr:E3 ubiquitin-protein ligase ubr4 family [Trichomonas vaginalis G3]EAY17308.1 hypothetical protein TVAG_266710 [Trichomonas vaginalis G3]KAI5523309.1 E3 ubiquitin-protein ligase ubr4 family [Trichomonas vaginalis G3]|eukprot:XP_001329531.1 hypothetical protein [Trichomonas vaginalis G3]